jgi:drug/metabolite transporter (DMT)-like permease
VKLGIPGVIAASDRLQTAALTSVAMLAFAGNSILCRLALRSTEIDPASFTAIRIGSAALALWLFAPRSKGARDGSWLSAVALFAYAATFSFAYVALPTGVGALVLFGAVQLTMIGWGFKKGERFNAVQLAGTLAAIVGLVMLLVPKTGKDTLSAISLSMMLSAGVAWGIYSLRGRGIKNPLAATRANFLLAVPFAGALLLAFVPQHIDVRGVLFACASGAITSGAGYMIWYSVLPRLRATQAATVQLCVPVLAAFFGFLFLGETLTTEQWVTAVVVLGGVSLAMWR